MRNKTENMLLKKEFTTPINNKGFWDKCQHLQFGGKRQNLSLGRDDWSFSACNFWPNYTYQDSQKVARFFAELSKEKVPGQCENNDGVALEFFGDSGRSIDFTRLGCAFKKLLISVNKRIFLSKKVSRYPCIFFTCLLSMLNSLCKCNYLLE